MNDKRAAGFSLIEMMVVLAIIGAVFVSTYQYLSGFRVADKVQQSESTLLDIKATLIRFSEIHNYFPCPDSDGDGLENRSTVTVGSETFQVCSVSQGTLPFVDMELKQSEIEDSYGHQILYAVNQEADDTGTVVICDNTSAASYFCNDITNGQPVFTLRDTPPLSGARATGDYYVCNDSVGSCSGTPANSALDSVSASIVLVAFNEDGHESLATYFANCASQSGDTIENCDGDGYFHAAAQSGAANFFDDQVVSISGYEIKSNLLSTALSWNSYTNTGSAPLTPTYQGFDLDSGDYTPLNDANNPDVVLVNRNVTTALDLGAGNDYMAIGNDLKESSDLQTGTGDDILYIVGYMLSNVALGDGNDEFVLGTDLTQTLTADAGDDLVWIQGSIASGSSLNMGAGDDILWLGSSTLSGTGNLNENIDGGADFDILVMETVEDWSDLTATEQARIQNFELVIFSDDGGGNRNYHLF